MSNCRILENKQTHWIYATPPIAAVFYPFLLKTYYAALSFSVTVAVASFLLSLFIPIYGFLIALNLGKKSTPTNAEIFLKQIALIAVASPTIFVADGVVTFMLGSPLSDTTLWLIFWIFAAAAAWLAHTKSSRPVLLNRSINISNSSRLLPVAHGISAVIIILLFLAMHLTNHLAGIFSEHQHRVLMNAFRFIYRDHIVEPAIVLLFLFQTISGIALLKKLSAQPAGFFRSLQIASGVYLLFFVLGHMNSVFIYARHFAGIKTDWDFATGAPNGLIHDAWNIRLVTHYFLGVFFVLSHLILAARLIAINHGVKTKDVNAAAVISIVSSAIGALLIMIGLLGVHFSN